MTPLLCLALTVTDGDSIRCDAERIRIRAIDSPELHRCPPRRTCTPGDGAASRETLRRFLAGGPVLIERLGCDRYGRTLATLSVNGRDAGAYMVARGAAVWRYGDMRPGRCR